MVRRELSSQPHHTGSSTGLSRSDASDSTNSTVPSSYSDGSLMNYYHDRPDRLEKHADYQDFGRSRSSFDSVNTYDSTISTEEDLAHRPESEVLLHHYDRYPSDAISSTPSDFGTLFSSNRRLLIHHDDATSDGNMNLRVDTEVFDPYGHSRKLILFHLRMYDLRDRRFSLRRYCRDSGREICKSSRHYKSDPPLTSARSNVQYALGHAFQQLRLTNEPSVSTWKSSGRQESGQRSVDDECSPRSSAGSCTTNTTASANTAIQMEFRNYAHITMQQRGLKRSKRYEYEFWGLKYVWKRQIYRDGHLEAVSYHLINDKTSQAIAHITPEPLTAREAQEEEEFGGWVPPCTMQITDRRAFGSLTNVAE